MLKGYKSFLFVISFIAALLPIFSKEVQAQPKYENFTYPNNVTVRLVGPSVNCEGGCVNSVSCPSGELMCIMQYIISPSGYPSQTLCHCKGTKPQPVLPSNLIVSPPPPPVITCPGGNGCPSGHYYKSCRGCTLQGTVLTCQRCQIPTGEWVPPRKSLDLSRSPGTPVENCAGRLVFKGDSC